VAAETCGCFQLRNAIARSAQSTLNHRVSETTATRALRRHDAASSIRSVLRKTVKRKRTASERSTSLVLNAVLAAYRAGSWIKTKTPVTIDKSRPPIARHQRWSLGTRIVILNMPRPSNRWLNATVGSQHERQAKEMQRLDQRDRVFGIAQNVDGLGILGQLPQMLERHRHPKLRTPWSGPRR